MPHFSIPPSRKGTTAKMQKLQVVVPSKEETEALARIAQSPLRVNREKIIADTRKYITDQLASYASPQPPPDSRSSASRKPDGTED